jgi:hypothetical protein
MLFAVNLTNNNVNMILLNAGYKKRLRFNKTNVDITKLAESINKYK